MEQFLMREVSEEEVVGDLTIRVLRTRNTNGVSRVAIQFVHSGKPDVNFSLSSAEGDIDEQIQALVRLLNWAIEEKCEIPEVAIHG